MEGFDKPIELIKSNVEVKSDATLPSKETDVVWSEEFIQEASMEFEKNIRLMMAETAGATGDAEFAESLLKVSQEAAAKVFERQPDQGASFADTLRYLAEGTESLQVHFIKSFTHNKDLEYREIIHFSLILSSLS